MITPNANFTKRVLPYNDDNTCPKLLSRINNNNGPVITMNPRIVTTIRENLGIMSERSATLWSFSRVTLSRNFEVNSKPK
jgi:hypothetical protein